MRVLIIGSGGREHALAAAIAASPLLTALYIAPGNPGTAALGTNVPIRAMDISGLAAFAAAQKIDLVVPGPEAPLVAGIADALAAHGIACCGPTEAAAALEGSKQFTKEIADAAGIPTAAWAAFEDADAAHDYVEDQGAPIVIKADGLAAGKGVVVAQTLDEAHEAITAMLEDQSLGAAGARLVIEDYLQGPELSVFALCDGTRALYLGCATDHKRVGERDTGPNTGGMGAIFNPPWATSEVIDTTMTRIIEPTLAAMASRGTPFTGFLFAGLMLVDGAPHLIEFNVRFGDPECETILPMLAQDLLPHLADAARGCLETAPLRWHAGSAATVVMCAQGYPGAYDTGSEIFGLEEAAELPLVRIFQAGTLQEQGSLLANGGRVLVVNGSGPDLKAALDAAYAACRTIVWEDGFYRRDIGQTALF